MISGTGKYATYGCSRAFNRAVCSNRAKIKESHLEQKLFAQLHTAFNTPEVLDSLVGSLIQFQGELLAGTELAQRIQELETQLRNLIGELAQIGGSEALRAGIRQREEELKGLKALKSNRKELSPAEITKKVKRLFGTSRRFLKPIRFWLRPSWQSIQITSPCAPNLMGFIWLRGSGTCSALDLRHRMVAGAGFEPATFGL